MYYYILGTEKGKVQDKFRERLADTTTDLGIAGEIVTYSPLKSLDDLLAIGLSKGYSTIVAVGNDLHINRVASAIMRLAPDHRPVLGALPTDPHSLVGTIVNSTNQKEALQTLKLRKLAYAPVAELDPGKYILTQATITLSRPVMFEIDCDTARIEIQATDVVITGDCHLQIQNRAARPSPLIKSLAWLMGASPTDRETSILHGNHIRIANPEPVPIVFEGEVLAKTPVSIHLVRRALKLIVARATVGQTSAPAPLTESAEHKN